MKLPLWGQLQRLSSKSKNNNKKESGWTFVLTEPNEHSFLLEILHFPVGKRIIILKCSILPTKNRRGASPLCYVICLYFDETVAGITQEDLENFAFVRRKENLIIHGNGQYLKKPLCHSCPV